MAFLSIVLEMVQMLFFISLILSVLLFSVFIYITYQIMMSKKENTFPYRGILKYKTFNELPPQVNALITKWILSILLVYLTIFFWLFRFLVGTDYSFFMMIYLILAFYIGSRYFLWYKEDLIPISKRRKMQKDKS